jgi:hypothetical protein
MMSNGGAKIYEVAAWIVNDDALPELIQAPMAVVAKDAKTAARSYSVTGSLNAWELPRVRLIVREFKGKSFCLDELAEAE